MIQLVLNEYSRRKSIQIENENNIQNVHLFNPIKIRSRNATYLLYYINIRLLFIWFDQFQQTKMLLFHQREKLQCLKNTKQQQFAGEIKK